MTSTLETPAPSLDGHRAYRHLSRGLLALVLVVVLALGAAVAWWTAATPSIYVSNDFFGETGQAKERSVTVSTTVRNEGRLEARLSPGAVPSNVSVAFQSSSDEAPTSSVGVEPGQEAVVVVTVTGDASCAADPGDAVGAYFSIRVESWGRSAEETISAPVQFPLCER